MFVDSFRSGDKTIRISQYQPSNRGRHPALLLVHGSGGAVTWWLDRFAPALLRFGVGLYAPHYFEKTGTVRATAETILDGRHFPAWLATLQDCVDALRTDPFVGPARIGVLGISLGGYLAIGLGASDPALRLVIELSGGVPPGFESQLSPESPPVLVIHGEKDHVVPVSEARKLQALLRSRNVRHQIEIFPHEDHWFSANSTPRLLMACGGFLAQYL